GIIQRHHLLLELQPGELAQQPAPQAPGRVVFAADREGGLGHSASPRRLVRKLHRTAIDPANASPRATFVPLGRPGSMLYLAYQTNADIMVPVRMLAQAGLTALEPWAASEDFKALRNLTAAYELISRAGLRHKRPAYGIELVRVGNSDVAVHED